MNTRDQINDDGWGGLGLSRVPGPRKPRRASARAPSANEIAGSGAIA